MNGMSATAEETLATILAVNDWLDDRWSMHSVSAMASALEGRTLGLVREHDGHLFFVLDDGTAWAIGIDMGFASAELETWRWQPMVA
jgi:hypothetical protein